MLDQYPGKINNISFYPIYTNTLHFVEDALDAGIAEKNFVTGEENWSPKFFDLLGYSENEIAGTTENFINNLLHPDDKEMFSNAVENLHKTLKFKKTEIRLKTKQGKYKWFENTNMIELDEGGKPLRIIGTIIPINKKKKFAVAIAKE